jgi:hypothetical protein
MGMQLSKYSMLHALGYGKNRELLQETKNILDRYKLFGLILHDPEAHQEFHDALKDKFERLDYITGSDFLFFALTSPSDAWKNRYSNRDYFGIWEEEMLLSPENTYTSKDTDISTYTIAQSLKIDYDDLPVIILTDNFQFNQYRVVKTCATHLERQMTEIGYFCTQKEKPINLISDQSFQELIQNIDLCGGNFQINNDDSLAMALTDFLTFMISKKNDTNDRELAKAHLKQMLEKFKKQKKFEHDQEKLDQINLFLLGGLSALASKTEGAGFSIDDECENESKIILKTYNKVATIFDSPDNEIYQLVGGVKSNRNELFEYDETDYSPLVISLCKVFEIEMNLSLVHWFRAQLKIEMPQYFKRIKRDNQSYTITPDSEIIRNPRPINLNSGKDQKWIAPGIGESLLVARTYLMNNDLPSEIVDYEKLLYNWEIIRKYRNPAAHTSWLTRSDFDQTRAAFNNLTEGNLFTQMNILKAGLKP